MTGKKKRATKKADNAAQPDYAQRGITSYFTPPPPMSDELQDGDWVELHGLKSVEHNGKRGVIVQRVPNGPNVGRWSVAIVADERCVHDAQPPIAIKPENLRLATLPPGDQTSGMMGAPGWFHRWIGDNGWEMEDIDVRLVRQFYGKFFASFVHTHNKASPLAMMGGRGGGLSPDVVTVPTKFRGPIFADADIATDEEYADPALREMGWPPICGGAMRGLDRVVRRGILDGPIDRKTPFGETPLMLAVGWNRVSTVELLLAHGACPRQTDCWGKPVREARRAGPACLALIDAALEALAPRFAVGTAVECNMGPAGWRRGTVVALDYAEPGMEQPVPYQVELANNGGLIFASTDADWCVRLPV
jgi:hypothetical protein